MVFFRSNVSLLGLRQDEKSTVKTPTAGGNPTGVVASAVWWAELYVGWLDDWMMFETTNIFELNYSKMNILYNMI